MPATQLAGIDLGNGWSVTEFIPPEKSSTGGHFSQRYKVTNTDGTKAFLKALDFSGALQKSDPLRALQEALEEYHFEKDLYVKCKSRHMSRIVTPILHGSVKPPVVSMLGDVHYIIFEIAEYDLRSSKAVQNFNNLEWILRNLHQSCVGLKQLHSNGIAHQDLKPSNVLIFEEEGSKLTDLGRSSDKSIPFKYDQMLHAGDMTHAPIDKLLGVVNNDFSDRYCSDLYLLGGLVIYYFLGLGMTSAIQTKLRMNPNLSGDSFSEVLPFVMQAFEEVLSDLDTRLQAYPDKIRQGLVKITKELCHPDPSSRGIPGGRSKSQRFDLNRYITRFDVLATNARLLKCR
jgi:serine/threonine protein kinase